MQLLLPELCVVETIEVSISQLTLKVSYCAKFTPPMLSNNTNLNLSEKFFQTGCYYKTFLLGSINKVLKVVLWELICVFGGGIYFWGCCWTV